MNCPYCDRKLESGYIYGDRYKLKWLPDTIKLKLGLWVFGGTIINYKNTGKINRPRIKSYKCNRCDVMIINLKEN